jgi:hypothetical protein
MQVLSEGSAAYTTKDMKLLAGIANIGHYILEKLNRAQRGEPGRLGTREQIQRLSSLVNFEPSSVRLYIKPF